jgi:hypothetical protein
MKKIISTLCLIGALLIILDTLNAGNALVLFVFAGVIPGTNLLVSPVDMMAATATSITIIVLRITVWSRIRSLLFEIPTDTQPRSKRATRHTA